MASVVVAGILFLAAIWLVGRDADSPCIVGAWIRHPLPDAIHVLYYRPDGSGVEIYIPPGAGIRQQSEFRWSLDDGTLDSYSTSGDAPAFVQDWLNPVGVGGQLVSTGNIESVTEDLLTFRDDPPGTGCTFARLRDLSDFPEIHK